MSMSIMMIMAENGVKMFLGEVHADRVTYPILNKGEHNPTSLQGTWTFSSGEKDGMIGFKKKNNSMGDDVKKDCPNIEFTNMLMSQSIKIQAKYVI